MNDSKTGFTPTSIAMQGSALMLDGNTLAGIKVILRMNIAKIFILIPHIISKVKLYTEQEKYPFECEIYTFFNFNLNFHFFFQILFV